VDLHDISASNSPAAAHDQRFGTQAGQAARRRPWTLPGSQPRPASHDPCRELARDLATLDLKGNDLPTALDGLAQHATKLFNISAV